MTINEKSLTSLLMLDNIMEYAPGWIYWKDINSIHLGCNAEFAIAAGFKNRNEMIGKSDYECVWSNRAEKYTQDDAEVINSGKSKLNIEDTVLLQDGKEVIVISNKVPLRDSSGAVIGILGIATDITDRKKMEKNLLLAVEKAEAANHAMTKAQAEEKKQREESELLKLENASHKALLEAHEVYVQRANQVAHDLRSPIASLTSILKDCNELTEKKRVNLRLASIRIEDIANNLLNQYTVKNERTDLSEERQPVLLSSTLLELISEKKFEYADKPVHFESNFSKNSYFVFIHVQLSSLKRTLSNLINNAVDAFDKKIGNVTLKLEADAEWVKIVVQDDGKGMPQSLIDKIINKIAVTDGKKEGHGIGLTQVHDTLDRNHGVMTIDSRVNHGTEITLTFPHATTPAFCAEEINIDSNDIVIVLDDDPSIHGAWDLRFESFLAQAPDIQVHHFEQGLQALDFINSFSDADKNRIFLLTDYELLNQDLTGIDVINRSLVKRSRLVTSHFGNLDLRKEVIRAGTKMLSKQLASEIPIILSESNRSEVSNIDVVIVEDNLAYIDIVKDTIFEDLSIGIHHTPTDFYKNLNQYPKDIPIFLDNNYEDDSTKGLEVADELHKKGYTRLCLLSGNDFDENAIPPWLKVLTKDAFNQILEWAFPEN